LYTDADAERVARMRAALADGLSAAEAAGAAMSSERRPDNLIEDACERMFDAVARYDEAGLHEVFDESLAAFGLEPVVRDLLLPVLRRIGHAFEDGRLEISHEHFASNLVRGRLMSLARLWGRGVGPLAILACPPGELHDISLLAFGLVMRSHGWRILFLGADTPTATVMATATTTHPDLVVLMTFRAEHVESDVAALRRLAQTVPLYLSGPGIPGDLCEQVGASRLVGDLVEAAGNLARSAREATALR
jgi:methanogenic corrinoid protein MtbC1